MSFTLSYIEFFKVRTSESVSMKPIEDIIFLPSRVCRENLRKHRLIFKTKTGGFDILYQTNPQATEPVLAPISKRTRFTFGFILTDQAFFKKFEPDLTALPQLYFSNLDPTGSILSSPTEILSEGPEVQVDDAVRIYPKTFVVNTDLTVAPAPSALLLKNKYNPSITLQTVTINNPLGLTHVSTKLNDPDQQSSAFIQDTGPYLLETDSGQPPPRTIYLDDQMARQNFSGITDIYWNNSQGNAAPNGNEFHIRFKLR